MFAEALRGAAMAPAPERAAERLLVEDFAVLAEAAGSPQRLRLLILTLAVTGRLSQRLPTDGDVVAILAKLRGENAPSTSKVRAGVQEDVTGPATLPEAWRWAEFPLVASIDSHLVDPAEFMDLPHVAPDNIEKGTGRLLEYRTIREDGMTSTKHRFFAGQIVYSKIRPNLSKAVLVDFEGLCSADMYPLTARIDRRFFHYFLLSPVFLVQVVKEDNRLAMPKVNQEQLRATVVPIPPLPEQKRIVARVDQLMALIDDLEAKQAKKRMVSTRFTEASLEALTTAEGPEEFDAAWTRVVENFPTVIDRAEKVVELRGAIRNLALRGVLTTRGPGEEPGHVVLGRVDAERERRIQAKEARRPEALSPLTPVEVPFPIPPSWTWARLGDLCWKVADGPHFSPKYVTQQDGVPFLSGRNIKIEGFELDSVKYVSVEDHRVFSERTKPEVGDVLYTKGGTTGIALVNTLDFPFSVWVHVAVLKLAQGSVDPYYVALALNSPHCYAQSQKYTHGIGNRDLGLTRMVLISLPVPPLAEQKRIVAKVEHLMRLCDDLEAKLRRAEDRASKLVEAVVQEMVA